MRRTKSLDVDYSDVQCMPWPKPMSRASLKFITNAAAVLLAMLASLSFASLGMRIGPFALTSAVFIVTSVLPRFRSRVGQRRH
ncbi:hypothetical protein [Arthrobacter sp. MDT1-65]